MSITSIFQSGSLTHHILEDHPLAQWKCQECGSELSSYRSLHVHVIQCHHPGQFECIQEQCNFVGHTRREVVNHCKSSHRKLTYQCKFQGCGKLFPDNHNLTNHERLHRGCKPYICRWPECRFKAAKLGNAIQHIRKVILFFNK